jgi:hypothetical protein
MIILRLSAPVLFAMAVLVSGCKKKDTAPAPEPAGSGSAAAAPATPPPPPATPPPAPPAAAGPPVSGEALAGIQLPKPKGVPDKAMWSQADTPTGGPDGDRLMNLIEGDNYWMSVRFLDCSLPAVKEAEGKAETERGAFAYCFAAPTGKIKDLPLIAPKDASSTARAVKAGRLVIIAGIGVAGEDKLKAADVEAFLGSLDLAAIAKL